MMKPGETGTVIGRSTRLSGELHCADDLQIEGDFEGVIYQTGGRLTVGADAHVYANITAPEVVVFGKIEGDIRATGRVDLRSSAVVVGDVFAGRLSMEENAALRGQVDPSRAGESEPAPREDAGPKVVETSQLRVAAQPRTLAQEQPVPIAARNYAPVTVRQQEYVAPVPVVTQSGRQLPSALAAFATGGRQDPGLDSGVYRNENSRADDEAPWRNRIPED